VSTEYISSLLGEKKTETPDYLASALQWPRRKQQKLLQRMLRPVRQERVLKELPKHLTNEELKKTAQNQIMNNVFKK